ncbi:MAG: AI-2E family transporter [Isosphaera sp.]|nr:AI-2E family transporter [Isosphaera sp.]
MPRVTAPPRPEPDWARLAALAGLTVVALYVCYLLLAPFLPAVAWAVALAAMGLPLHRRLRRAVGSENLAAAVSTVAVVLVIAVPTVLVAVRIGHETRGAVRTVQEQAADGRLRETVARLPGVGGLAAELDPGEVERQARAALAELGRRSFGVIEGVTGAALQALTAVFVLFFCFRDRHHLLAAVGRLLPLPPADAERVIDRADGAIHATVYGTVLTSALQATTGGLMFWLLGLPAPVLWGAVMFVLGVLPFVGAFLVWVPAAAFLAADGRWGAAAALTGWGLVMAGVVTNAVYAWVAGDRMKLHPAPALLAFIGGLAVFGVSGMVLGPCTLAVTVALLEVWRHRLPGGAPVATVAPPSAAAGR